MAPKILIIEDEQGVFDLLDIFLKKRGCEVLCSVTGADGERSARIEKPAVILIDAHLPDADGLDVLRRIRCFDKESKIFLYSGLFNEELEKEAKALGAEGFMNKASEINVIIDMIVSATRHVSGDI